MTNKESRALRAGIRSGVIDCPTDPYRCDRGMAEHSSDCPWDRAIKLIYEVERELEGDRG